MALFPAYAPAEAKDAASETTSSLDWLTNVSFTVDATRDSLLFPTFKDDHEIITGTDGATESLEVAYKDTKGASKRVDDYKSKHRKKSNKKKKDSNKDAERRPEVGPPKKIFINQFDKLSLRDAFRIDQKSDRTNLAFSSFAPVQVAKYKRKRPYTEGDGLTGLRDTYISSVKRYFSYRDRLKDSFVTSDLSKPKLPWGTLDQNPVYHYIPLKLPDAKEADLPEENSETAKRNTVLNQRLRDNPHDVRLWLEFVKFQSDAVDVSAFIDSETTGNRREKMVESVIVDRKLAILDRAIENNPKAVQLIVYKYNLCKDIWETDKLVSEWKKLLFIHPNNTSLWQQHLLFFQTKFSTFTVSKFVKLNEKCFSTLKKILEGTFQSHRALPYMEEQVLSIFCNYCQTLYQSGYQEKAVANYQALIEFNFFAPEQFSSASLEDRLAFFEPFWDSGVPRFGDENAPGWSKTMKNKEFNFTQADLNNNQEEDEAIRPSELKWRNWLRLERVRSKNNWMPWLSRNGDESCDDGERMVLLDDVMPTLFNIQEISNKFLLIVQFLRLLGAVDISINVGSVCDNLQRNFAGYVADISDAVNAGRYFKWKFYSSSRTSNSIPLESSICRSEKLDTVINTVFENARVLFKDHLKYRRLVTLLWIRWKVSKINFSASVEDLERRNRIKEVKRFIKNLLKMEENRHDYDLWTEHCLFEVKCGNVGEARKVFDVLVSTHESLDRLTTDGKSSVCNIYAKYANCELSVGEHLNEDGRARLLWLLTSFGETRASTGKVMPSPAAILKARLRYKTMVDQQINSEVEGVEERWCPHYMLVSLVTCSSIFEYLTVGLAAAEEVVSNALQTLEIEMKPWNDAIEEWLTPTQIRRYTIVESLYRHLLQLHVVYSNSEASAPLGLLRNVLSRALHMFPANVYFNHLFLDIEGKSQLGMRLRNHYNGRLKESCSADITSAIFAIMGELERIRNIICSQGADSSMSYETGITQRLRALFESCVKHSQLCHCVLIWRLYLKFEAMQGHLKNCKAVFYRALQHCPWAKIIYMDAVQMFPEDLQELHDLMTEKEIRIMAPLEEVALLLELEGKSDQLPNPQLSTEEPANSTNQSDK